MKILPDIAIFLLLSTISIAQDLKIYDQDWNLKYRIEGGRIYDRDWTLKGYIKDGEICDRDWNRKGFIRKEK